MDTPYPNYPQGEIMDIWTIANMRLIAYITQYATEYWLVNLSLPLSHSQKLVYLDIWQWDTEEV